MELEELLETPIEPFSHIYGKNGHIFTNNTVSYYKNMVGDDNLTFDVGNQKVLANMTILGEVKSLTFYRENHLTEEKPGVWVNKTLAQTKKITFDIKINGESLSLNKSDHDFVIDTLEASIPRIQHHFKDIDVIEIPFCPIHNNNRKSMLIIGFWIKNKTDKNISVEIPTPPLYQRKYSDQQNVLIVSIGKKGLELAPRVQKHVALALIDPDCYMEKNKLRYMDIGSTLIDTVTYFKKHFGSISSSDKRIDFTIKRSNYQSLLALAMDSDNNIVGSNWGSFPATERVWNKDMYYAAMPTVMNDAYLCRKVIRWFTKYGIKPQGTKFNGGLEHSASNALSAGILSGLYYHWFGDKEFFSDNLGIVDSALNVIKGLTSVYPKSKLSLCRSEWISDAYSLGDYHTGTNICLWASCYGMADICFAIDRRDDAVYLQKLCIQIKKDIAEFLTVHGPLGLQWPEGRNQNGQYRSISVAKYKTSIREQGLVFIDYMIKNGMIDLLMHDGEESDTTMAPFYNFVNLSDSVYQHTMQFAGSIQNPTYVPEINGISWGKESGATFPGFISVLMGHSNNINDFISELYGIIKLQDLDGSWWWWPYRHNPQKKVVVRNFGCGKCGWASGMLVCLLITQYMGLTINQGVLRIAPMHGINEYNWHNALLGGIKFDLTVNSATIQVRNLTSKSIIVEVEGNHIVIESGKSYLFERS